jgi:hypothetical protein
MLINQQTPVEPPKVQPPMALKPPHTWPRPSVGEYGPRVVRESVGSKIGSGIFIGFAAIVALVAGIVLPDNAAEREALLANGKPVPATVIRKFRDDDDRFLDYRYELDGLTQTARDKVSRAVYRSAASGETITVTVNPKNPSQRRIGSFSRQAAETEGVEQLLAFIAMGGLMGGLYAMMRGLYRREARILTDWPATSGVVVSASNLGKVESATSFNVQVQYRAQGEMHEKKTMVKQNQKFTLKPGDYLDVLYNPDKPSQCYIRQQITMAEIDPGI